MGAAVLGNSAAPTPDALPVPAPAPYRAARSGRRMPVRGEQQPGSARRVTRREMLKLLGVGATALGLAACSSPPAAPAAPTAGGVAAAPTRAPAAAPTAAAAPTTEAAAAPTSAAAAAATSAPAAAATTAPAATQPAA